MPGKHRAESGKPAVAAWLGAGAITLGIGAALTGGAAAANASTDDSGGSSAWAPTHKNDDSGEAHHSTDTGSNSDTESGGKDTTAVAQTVSPTTGSTRKSQPDDQDDPDSAADGDDSEAPNAVVHTATHRRAIAADDDEQPPAAGDDSTPAKPTANSLTTTSTDTQAVQSTDPDVTVDDETTALPAAKAQPSASANPLNAVGEAIQSFLHNIQVQYFNTRPKVASYTLPTLNADGTYSGQVVFEDKDGDPLTYSAYPPYDGSTVTVDQSGNYTLTPSEDALTQPKSGGFYIKVVESNADAHYHGLSQIVEKIVRTALYSVLGQFHFPPYYAPGYGTSQIFVPGVPWGNTDPSPIATASALPSAKAASTAAAAANPLTTLSDTIGQALQDFQDIIHRTFFNSRPTITVTEPVRNAEGTFTGRVSIADADGDPLTLIFNPNYGGLTTVDADGNYTYTPSESVLSIPGFKQDLYFKVVETNADKHFHGPEQILYAIVRPVLYAFFGQFGYPPYAASDWGTTTSNTIFLVNPTGAVTTSA